jgi:hypothetical protein
MNKYAAGFGRTAAAIWRVGASVRLVALSIGPSGHLPDAASAQLARATECTYLSMKRTQSGKCASISGADSERSLMGHR